MSPWVVVGLAAAGMVGWTLGRASGLIEAANLHLFIDDLKTAQDHAPCRDAIHRLSAALLEVGAEDSDALIAEAEQYLQDQDGP